MLSTRPTARVTSLMSWTPKYLFLAGQFENRGPANAGPNDTVKSNQRRRRFQGARPVLSDYQQGLAGVADGGHFFDLLAEDVIFDYIITIPGYPRHIEGRNAVAELYRPYGTTIVLDRCYDLAVHRDTNKGVVVLEYASEGQVVATGAVYANRYISVLTITDRKVTQWRDYLDPLAVLDRARMALTFDRRPADACNNCSPDDLNHGVGGHM